MSESGKESAVRQKSSVSEVWIVESGAATDMIMTVLETADAGMRRVITLITTP